MGQLLFEDHGEVVVARQAHGPLLQLAFSVWGDALGKLCACFVALGARLLQRHIRIAAERDAVLFARLVVAKMPGTSTCGGDTQTQAERIVQVIGFGGRFGATDGEIGKRHVIELLKLIVQGDAVLSSLTFLQTMGNAPNPNL
ncbi:hypothetical protein [Pseudomonas protegens]|uniref:hypothetical protein n=1 Tax=Pseudomonas protegens TaxID=380021 RepID=UPI001F35BE6C|nr:hypothetical protein [Pseudomonas protegens]